MDSKKFLCNGFKMAAASFGINTLDIGFRAYISSRMGTEGMGLYTLILSVFFFAATLATSGISLSVTRLVTEAEETEISIHGIMRRALILAAILGSAAAVITYISADIVSVNLLSEPRAAYPLRILAVALPFISVNSCFGGYFIAGRKILESAKYQIFDEFCKIIVTFALCAGAVSNNAAEVCSQVIFASVIGEVFTCGYAFLLYSRACEKHEAGRNDRKIYCKIAGISTPVALSSYFRAGLSTLENILIPFGFQKLGGSRAKAVSDYGVLKGMVMPTVTFPSTLFSPFFSLLIPEISEAAAKNNRKAVNHLVGTAIRSTLAYSILSAAVLITSGKFLGELLYNNTQSGFLISLLAPITPFIYLDSAADAALKALNEQVASLKYNTIEGISRIALLFFLIPLYGTNGFIIMLFLSNFISALLGIRRLLQVTQMKLNAADSVFKPLISVTVSIVFANTVISAFNPTNIIGTLLGIGIVCISYIVLVSLWCEENPLVVKTYEISAITNI